jgi:hypothetical protein
LTLSLVPGRDDPSQYLQYTYICTKGKPADPRYLNLISMSFVYSFFIVAEYSQAYGNRGIIETIIEAGDRVTGISMEILVSNHIESFRYS